MFKKVYPYSAIVGQEELKLALLLNTVNPKTGGVLIRGEKGTAKSTTVRALAALLPEIKVVAECPCACDPDDESRMCDKCKKNFPDHQVCLQRIRVVTLPLNATEDRVIGGIDFNLAVKHGVRSAYPGLLAEANRSILYVDEVNLLDDHIVDIILDAAASGENRIEREGISFRHPAAFILVGTMNPEEGELRPQLLDRFGLCVIIEGIQDPEDRVAIMERRHAFDMDPDGFCAHWETASKELAEKIEQATFLYPEVAIERPLLFEIASYCLDVGVDGHRGDIIMLKTAKTLAAYHGRQEVDSQDIETAAGLVLPHRVRRQPLQTIGNDVQSMLEKGFGQ